MARKRKRCVIPFPTFCWETGSGPGMRQDPLPPGRRLVPKVSVTAAKGASAAQNPGVRRDHGSIAPANEAVALTRSAIDA
jgi:hypothetical protein